MSDFFDSAMKRLASSDLSVSLAMRLSDVELLSQPFVGRKTLRVVRSFHGPVMPLPVPEFADDEEYDPEYEDAYNSWQIGSDIPNLREAWCPPSPEPIMVFEDIDFLSLMLEDLEA